MKQIGIGRRELPYEIDEELKTLRTNLLFSGDDKHVIMLTSCLSGEGKSTVSLELACSLSDLGKSVLLIDTDLRKSVLESHVVSGNITYGLTHYLVGQCQADEAVYSTDVPKLYIIPAGPTPPNPSELLAGNRMAQLTEAAKRAYDYVIVDCAPLGMVVDAAVVAPRCDGAILVIESGIIQRQFAKEVLTKLKATRCPVLGVVLNKVSRKTDKYYGYGHYNRYYSKRYEAYYK